MVRVLATLVVLCAALLGWARDAEAHGACCGAEAAGVAAAETSDGGHTHHQTHDAPHVPHDEPDGCRHECAGCSPATPMLAALPPLAVLPAPAPTGLQWVTADHCPCGPPPTTPFQVPRS